MVSSSLHLTRTFLPRRSLSTTSIIVTARPAATGGKKGRRARASRAAAVAGTHARAPRFLHKGGARQAIRSPGPAVGRWAGPVAQGERRRARAREREMEAHKRRQDDERAGLSS